MCIYICVYIYIYIYIHTYSSTNHFNSYLEQFRLRFSPSSDGLRIVSDPFYCTGTVKTHDSDPKTQLSEPFWAIGRSFLLHRHSENELSAQARCF